MTQQPHLFCFGLGYTALALARVLKQQGWRVTGTCRSTSNTEEARALGLEIVIFDPDHPVEGLAQRLAGVTHLLSSVPPGAAGDPVLQAHGATLAEAAPRLKWIGYLSTTGVYGDRQGGWVDEQSPLTPSGERGQRRLDAETAWLALPQPAHLFRLAGIYGPGRSVLDTIRAGKARRVLKPGQVFSRIHRDDIVQILLASFAHPNPGAAYNACDDDAADPAEVTAYACKLLNVAPPPEVPFAEAALSPMARSFYDDNKRVRNDRIKRELGVTLKYPDYRAGLTALLATESATSSSTTA
ncbi:SDR family oxidoreductase [Dongia sp.]|uniref:SDR family oxidoreductase n=1 Tax=Dongia sp. TaxID=1977262 RepID=UPI003750A5EB